MDAPPAADLLPPRTASNDIPSAKAAPTPPTSEDMNKHDGASSELSDLELEDDDIGDIEPDHYWEGGKVPVFKPTMDQFRDFKKFAEKIDKYGMQSGIVKIIPPKEWRDSLPALDEAVKTIRVKNPIIQEFAGTHGVYTQANIEKQRTYNLPQWKALTEELSHQPPAKRGERRKQEPAPRPRSTRSQTSTPAPRDPDAPKRRPGRPRKRPLRVEEPPVPQPETRNEHQPQVPPTPVSPEDAAKSQRSTDNIKLEDVEANDQTPTKPRGRQPKSKSISSRRKNNRSDDVGEVDEAAFVDFSYLLENVDEFTRERCQDLEDTYWRTVNYGQPMYGADMPGSLFDDTTTSWNVAKLENLLDALGTKVPGVNTAYLYLGMWKATFAWHLEDVDLYSINYIHFGAPKQWYSISQCDARRFEAAMRSIWPNDAKNCDQFLRHKTYLVSPHRLEKDFNIKVNRLIHYEGEFVITYPYGYHSGYNIGYNCAESVNFALEAWLNYGKIARKCNCEPDNVWVDVGEIERRLRGEPTPEYYEETDVDDGEGDEEAGLAPSNLPSPPASLVGKPKPASRKRKRESAAAAERQPKRIRIRVKPPAREPCILCPNGAPYDVLLPADSGQKAHRLCALYTPETYLTGEEGDEKVCNVANIGKARLDLKCNYCRSKRGACFQCSSKKCTRAYHATCAAAAGVQIDTGPVPTFGEDGTEYVCEGYDFRCRFHRPKRPKNIDGDTLEKSNLIVEFARSLKTKDIVQAQHLGGDIFAGTVAENRPSEQTVIIDLLPEGGRLEVEWKYLLVLDPADSLRPKPSPNAQPLPEHLENSESVNVRNRTDGRPEMDEPFCSPNAPYKWAEFNTCAEEEMRNPSQARVDISKPEQLWFYLGKTSTEARAYYTEDPAKPCHNRKSVFLETVKPPRPRLPPERRSLAATFPGANAHASSKGATAARRKSEMPYNTAEKPYRYKPKPGIPLSPSTPFRGPSYSFYTGAHVHQPVPAVAHAPRLETNGAPSRPVDSQHTNPYCYDTIRRPHPPRSFQAPGFPPKSQAAQTTAAVHAKPTAPPAPNVMGASPSPSGGHRPTLSPPTVSLSMTELEYVSYIQKYPYLRNAYLRRPKRYISPYAENGEYSPEHKPRPQEPTSAPTTQPYGSPGMAPGYPLACDGRPGGFSDAAAESVGMTLKQHPGLTFQTAQEFQRHLATETGDETINSNMQRFERLIQQLNSSGSVPPGTGVGEQLLFAPTTAAEAVDERASAAPPSTGGGLSPANGRSPVRPEFSPLSDAGGFVDRNTVED